MKLFLSLINFYCIVLSSFSAAMDISYMYTIAQKNDEPSILNLIDGIGQLNDNDSQKIVIVPKKFRQLVAQKAIESKRLFISKHNPTGHVIALRKLFPITNPVELHSILTTEIRCSGTQKTLTNCGFFDSSGKYTENSTLQIPLFDNNDTYIYSGGSYTHPEYRGQSINKKLTDFALTTLKQGIIKRIQTQKSKNLIFVYGIVKENSGENGPGSLSDRTPILVNSFLPFAKEIASALGREISEDIIEHYRFSAFKPSFDPESQELQPLPDRCSIPGFGCVLSYNLN